MVGFQPEAAKHGLALALVPYAIDPAANAGDGARAASSHDRLFRYRLEQAEPNQRRCKPQPGHRILAQRSIGQIGKVSTGAQANLLRRRDRRDDLFAPFER